MRICFCDGSDGGWRILLNERSRELRVAVTSVITINEARNDIRKIEATRQFLIVYSVAELVVVQVQFLQCFQSVEGLMGQRRSEVVLTET